MADGLFYNDLREPAISADLATITLAATNKAIIPAASYPALGGNYFSRVGKKIKLRAFGRMATGATPGSLTWSIMWGTGVDANGTAAFTSSASTLATGQTSPSWFLELYIHCRSIGATGTLFLTGHIQYHPTLVAATNGFLLWPSTAPAVSGALDLTQPFIPSLQALRSGSTAETMQVHDMELIALN